MIIVVAEVSWTPRTWGDLCNDTSVGLPAGPLHGQGLRGMLHVAELFL